MDERLTVFSRACLCSFLAVIITCGSAFAANTKTISNPGQIGLSQQVRDIARGVVNRLASPDASAAKAETLPIGLAPGTVYGSFDGVERITEGPKSADARAFGSFGIPYTSTRVVHNSTKVRSSSPAFLSSTYPYRAIGRLTFLVNGNSAYCSASLIRRSVIVTAAHCLGGFGAAAFYSDWQFTPGYFRSGPTSRPVQPYGTWTWQDASIPASWFNGSDSGIGSARNNDVAVILLAKDRRNRFIGDLTGYLSYGWNSPSFVSSPKTGDLSVAAVSTLGYPCMLDDCGIMQRTDGPTYVTTVDDALQYWQGSNFTGGSSGGPWIVNFKSQDPVFSDGASAGDFSTMRVVGVTSWGAAGPNAPKDNYSSRFGQNAEFPNSSYGSYGAGNIGALLQSVCTGTPYNSTMTYEQLGYCN